MTSTTYKVINPEHGVPIKAWIDGVTMEEAAEKQLRNVASLPFVHKWVAAMPDVHWGIGATVGSVIPTRGAIVPAAVGVDIGCGVIAVQTSLNARNLPDNLHAIRTAIESAVPHGRTDNGGRNDRGAWANPPERNLNEWLRMKPGYDSIIAKHPKLNRGQHASHLGTLGTGNHFIEVCLDESETVWFMLHSGSRGVGNRMGSYFIELAKKDMERFFVNLPDRDLAYFPEHTEHFDDYVEAHVFKPLEMAHATFRQPLPDALKPLMSNGYHLASEAGKSFEFVQVAPAATLAPQLLVCAKLLDTDIPLIFNAVV